MSHQVVWTKAVEQFFADAANLSPIERDILRCRVMGQTRVQTAFFMNMSVSSIDKCVARLKKKYDIVQREYPDKLRPRRSCAEETYMDEN